MTARETMMEQLESVWGIEFVRTTEEFNGQTEGIWMSGENREEYKDGLDLFNYWAGGDKYDFGVHVAIGEWAEKNGWWFEWNDPGTIMLWPS